MSTFTIKSKVIANRDADPSVLSNPAEGQGGMKAVIGVDQTGAAIMDAGSTVRLLTVPSNARLHTLEYSRQTLGTSTIDFTAWFPTTVSSPQSSVVAAAVISSSAFIAGLVGTDAAVGWTTAFGVVLTPALNESAQPLWQFLGLVDDPQTDIDLGFSVRVATAEQGYIGMKTTYVD